MVVKHLAGRAVKEPRKDFRFDLGLGSRAAAAMSHAERDGVGGRVSLYCDIYICYFKCPCRLRVSVHWWKITNVPDLKV